MQWRDSEFFLGGAVETRERRVGGVEEMVRGTEERRRTRTKESRGAEAGEERKVSFFLFFLLFFRCWGSKKMRVKKKEARLLFLLFALFFHLGFLCCLGLLFLGVGGWFGHYLFTHLII